jgi:hypothetical protein
MVMSTMMVMMMVMVMFKMMMVVVVVVVVVVVQRTCCRRCVRQLHQQRHGCMPGLQLRNISDSPFRLLLLLQAAAAGNSNRPSLPLPEAATEYRAKSTRQ